ncbi:MAG: NAD+ synthase [Spirochaetes bacterium]|nr:NAD+ synthase [Spirochaetota bacterium]
MKIAIAQINPIIADIEGNYDKICKYIALAKGKGADLVIFPEMSTIGYPPMDLLEHRKLIDDNLKSLEAIAPLSSDCGIICGYVDYNYDNPPMLYNAAAFMYEGKVQSKHYKTLLPTYDVFDELRYFSPATSQEIVTFKGIKFGITICEDIWNDMSLSEDVFMEFRRYAVDPIENCIKKGAEILVNISASPYVKGKNSIKWSKIQNVAKKYKVPVIYVNQVGGNDSLIFDGNSFVIDRKGDFILKARDFEEDCIIFDTEKDYQHIICEEDFIADIEKALILGIRDYVFKSGFKKVVLGLSGGIDSALTACLAVFALGADNVLGITMPSQFSSKGSVDDSVQLAHNLGIQIHSIPIKYLFDAYIKELSPYFGNLPFDITEENIQARIRGNILMSFSNKFGMLLLTTGNKSELSMGYCTLYGDMAGGLAVLSDVPKTLVYALSYYINRDKEIIPRSILEKAPSAELRENQKDQDSLPPYEILDQIIERYVELKMSAQQIIADGFDPEIVHFVLRTIDKNEYKRKQAPIGLKVTTKAFGVGRRIPVVQRFKH